jgi:hypothetical protein
MSLSTIFGKPGKGIHKHYCGVAVADVAMTGMAALVISNAVFGVPTALNKKIGLVPDVNSQIRD